MKGLPLHIRIPILIIFSIALVGLTSTFFVHQKIINLLQDDLNKLGMVLATAMANHAVEHIIYYERLPLRDLFLEAVNKDDDIDYIFVYEPDQGIIGHSFAKGFPKDLLRLAQAGASSELFQTTPIATSSDLITHIQTPVLKGLPARLHIGLNESKMHHEANLARNAILVITLITIIVGCIFSVILSWRITAPLRRFSRSITAYGSGRGDPIPRSVKDIPELRNLAESFNNMVSARQNAKTALRESEKRFRSMTENSSDWIWEFDENEIFTYASPRVRDLLGYEPEEIVGRSLFAFFPRDKVKIMRKEFSDLKENHKPFFSRENTNQHKNGHQVVLESSGVPFFDTKGAFKGYRGIDRDITARKNVEKQLTESLEEKEVLLKEIHHRVKNNMQIISSLLFLQANNTDNAQAKAILHDAQDRVKSMGLIHEILYRSGNLAHIKFNDYITTLIENISYSYRNGGSVRVMVESTDIMLPIDKAIPCGLIVNELLTNSFKHAFPEGVGEIRISLFCADSKVTLTVEDSGVGFRKDRPDLASNNTLGMSLINTLAVQLDASLVFETNHGVKCIIVFEVDSKKCVCCKP